MKGGTAAIPGRGLFTGGNLGSNGIATVGDPNATLGTNYGVYLLDGNAAVADRMTLGPGHPLLPTSVWDLFTNQITNNDFDPASVRNLGPICFGPPIIDPSLPAFVAFTHSGGPYRPVLPSPFRSRAERAAGRQRGRRRDAQPEDALGPGTVTIKRAKRICAPADKNDEDPTAPLDPEHLTYYTIKQTSPFTKVKRATVDNQFGVQRMSLSKPDRMMVPTAKSTTGAPAPLTDPIDHYKCYKVGGAKLNVPDVRIIDQFGGIEVDIKKPLHLCLPAIKENEGPLVDPATALMCYKVNGPPQEFRPVVNTLNQFGPDSYDIFGPRDFCVPSTVTIP